MHTMHKTQPTVNDACGVCLSVRLHCAKMAEQIKMLFGHEHSWGPMAHGALCYTGVQIPPQARGERDLLLNFGTPFISLERLKLET